MCGIAGYFNRGNPRPSLALDLPAAIQALHHRGPDDHGLWFSQDRQVGLGHARLSILDLSAHGHQPMVSADGRFVMVFNGEIYNYRDIRRELEPGGYQFRGSGDSEVILAAFAQWGVAAVHRFIGMFAIALWDRKERVLHLLRDRLGVKPLYYGWNGDTLWFGSELKAVRAFTHWSPQIDTTALSDYFQFGYINAPRSIYRNVFKVPPGYAIAIGRSSSPQLRCYWSVLPALADPLTGPEDDLADQLEALMVDAFKLRMVSDVPVGVFLSGGIDSSLVTALLQRHFGTIHTFTIGFNEPAYDEAPHARRIAEHLGTQHTERILEASEAQAILPRWGDLYDEPYSDPSGIPTYLVSRVASSHVKVVLSADGGDELFSGYEAYNDVLKHVAQRTHVPSWLRAPLSRVLRELPLDAIDRAVVNAPPPFGPHSLLRTQLTWPARRARDYIGAPTDGAAYEQAFTHWPANELSQLIGRSIQVRERADAYPGSLAEQMCLWDLHNYLPGDILTKVDRATMAVSIEGREPLIDHRIVEFAFRLPLHLRRGSLGNKHLLRRVLYRHVPQALVDRPKQGFSIPLQDWLRGDLRHLVDRYLGSQALQEQDLLDQSMIAKTLHAFARGDGHSTYKIWTLLAFQMWRERWA